MITHQTILAIDPGTKRCRKCNVTKPLSQFYRCRLTKDGKGSYCIECEQMRDRRAYTARYRKTKAYLMAQAKYKRSEKAKETNRIYLRNQRLQFPQKPRAWDRVKYAKRKKKIKVKNSCSRCRQKRKLQAHHPDYLKPLDVIWVCPKCHYKIHHVV